MKIAMLSMAADPVAADGAAFPEHGTYVTWLAQAMADRGHDMSVFARRETPGQAGTRALTDGATVEYLAGGPPRPQDEETLVGHVGELAEGLRTRLEQLRPDVVHALSWSSGLAAVVATRSLGVPVVQTFYDLGVPPQPRPVPTQARAGDRLRLERAVAHDADIVLAPCSEQADTLTSMGVPRAKLRVVPAGIDVDRFRPDGPAEGRGDTARVVSLDGLWEGSGVEALLRVMAFLPDVELWLAGGPTPDALDDDPDAKRVRELATRLGMAGRLRLTGRLPQDATPYLLRSADLVVTVRPYDTLGLSTLEAMACGVPVVAAAHGGPVDMVVDGSTGVQVPPGRPDALLVALRRLLDDPVRREGYGVASADRIRARYPWTRVAHDVEEVYRHAASHAAVSAAS